MAFENWFYNECLPKITDEARSTELKTWADVYFLKINKGYEAIAAFPDHVNSKKLQATIESCNAKIKNDLLAELEQIRLDQLEQEQQLPLEIGSQNEPAHPTSIRCGG